ncbi:hypothetical protein QVD17_05490 [Tagetes erecta]|uniref:Uncharacterized protein n=1 Tax=Tagetes erecta TaxID=13708 RepID=A0AAD8LC28_TARER|nr:hypothetical protein QVD17_05490 [Tagetes erecta]
MKMLAVNCMPSWMFLLPFDFELLHVQFAHLTNLILLSIFLTIEVSQPSPQPQELLQDKIFQVLLSAKHTALGHVIFSFRRSGDLHEFHNQVFNLGVPAKQKHYPVLASVNTSERWVRSHHPMRESA